MVNYLKKEKLQILICDILFIIIGALFCFWPESSMSTLEALTSGILVLYGIFYIICYLFSSIRIYSILLQGLFFIIIGLLVSFIASMFIVGFGIILIIQGLKIILYSAELKTLSAKKWYIDFIIGSLLFIFGLVIIILCIVGLASKVISIILGVFLIVYGISDLSLVFGFKRDYSNLRKRIVIKLHNNSNNNSSDKNNKNNGTQDCDDYTDYNIN